MLAYTGEDVNVLLLVAERNTRATTICIFLHYDGVQRNPCSVWDYEWIAGT